MNIHPFVKRCRCAKWALHEAAAISHVHDHYTSTSGHILDNLIPRPLEIRGKCISLVRAKTDLYQYVFDKKRTKDLSNAEQFVILKHLQMGLSAIHRAGMVHNDIKPENILLSSSGHWQITDFEGATYECDEYAHKLLPKNTRIRTKYYAPKVWEHGSLAAANDIWSTGVTMHVVRYGEYHPKGIGANESNFTWQYALDSLLSKSPKTRTTSERLGWFLEENMSRMMTDS